MVVRAHHNKQRKNAREKKIGQILSLLNEWQWSNLAS